MGVPSQIWNLLSSKADELDEALENRSDGRVPQGLLQVFLAEPLQDDGLKDAHRVGIGQTHDDLRIGQDARQRRAVDAARIEA